jgi:hypothetical protein
MLASPSHKQIAQQLDELAKRYGLKISSKTVTKDILRLRDNPKGHIKLIEKYIARATGHEQEVVDLIFTLWNALPDKTTGISPSELAEQSSRGRRTSPDWQQLMPVLQGLQGLFLEPFTKGMNRLSKKEEREAVRYVHVMHMRFWHTCHPRLLDNPPYLLIEQEAAGYGIRLNKQQRIANVIFHNPELPNDPDYFLRTMMGVHDQRYPELYTASFDDEYDSYYWDDAYFEDLAMAGDYEFRNVVRPPTVYKFGLWVLGRILADWYQNDIVLQKAFTLTSWKQFFHEMLSESQADEGGWYSIDRLFSEVYAQFPKDDSQLNLEFFQLTTQYGDTEQKLKQTTPDRREMAGMMAMVQFGNNLFEYFLLPGTLYLPFIEPVYQDAFDIEQEVADFHKSGMTFKEWAAKPPAAFRLTSLGQRVLWRRSQI